MPSTLSPHRPGPLPAQQGSVPQTGLPIGQVEPTGSQQQQPLQSVQLASVALGWQLQLEAPPVALEPPALEPPALEPPVPLEPPALEPPVAAPSVGMGAGVLSLLQAPTSPTV